MLKSMGFLLILVITIVFFENRKIRDAVLKNKSKLKDLTSLNLDIAGLYANSKIFIRPSLCAYYKILQYNYRILKRYGLVKQVRTDDKMALSKLKHYKMNLKR